MYELAISQNECEDRYDLPRLETIPTFDANIKVDYSDCKTNYQPYSKGKNFADEEGY